eukprot:868430-Pleurochrysis_carterae.AAC.7
MLLHVCKAQTGSFVPLAVGFPRPFSFLCFIEHSVPHEWLLENDWSVHALSRVIFMHQVIIDVLEAVTPDDPPLDHMETSDSEEQNDDS